MPFFRKGNFVKSSVPSFAKQQMYEELFNRFYRKLYNYGSKFTCDMGLVEDAIQEVFITLWQRDREEIHSIQGYIFTSFRHELLRKITNQTRLLGENLDENYTFQIELATDERVILDEQLSETSARLAKALALLTEKQKEVVFLKFYQQMNYEEIALVLNISIKGAYKLMGRAIHLLRQELSKEQLVIINLIFSSNKIF